MSSKVLIVATGKLGATGPAGANGSNGTNGTNGTNGADGTFATAQTIETVSSTTYTVALADPGKVKQMDNASAIAVTVPTNASAAIPVGSHVDFVQAGAGRVTFAGDTGVTVPATPGLTTRTQGSACSLLKVATNTWRLIGDLASSTDAAEVITVPVSDETTTIQAGTAKFTFRMPFAMTVASVRASLGTASSSGVVTVDINDGGTSILSTKLTIDAGEKTSVTAATPAVLSDTALADDAEITIDIDTAGTGASGLKVTLLGARA